MKNLILILAIVIMPTFLFSAESTENDFSKKKKYTEKEFRDELKTEVKRILKKMGRKEIVTFSEELLKKEDLLILQELSLKKREEELTFNIKGFNKGIVQFEKKQNRILGCLEDQEKEQKKRIVHMVDVVAGMKPANAANLLSVQDANITVNILSRLNPAKVSKIFNVMDKEISARLQKQYMTMKK